MCADYTQTGTRMDGVEACVSTEHPRTSDAATASMDPTVMCDVYTETGESRIDKDLKRIETFHRREKRILMDQIREMKDFVGSLKMANNNLKKDREEAMEMQKKLQEEIRKIRVINNKLQKKCNTLTGTEVTLRTELERLRVANTNLNDYCESKIKDCEEEKKILVIRNQELQKELEEIKTNIAVQNLQVVSCNSQTQEGLQCGIETADEGKVSLDNFHYIRMLGEGGFGTVVLATGKLPGRSQQMYALKALKKRGITTSHMRAILAEKEALILASGHPFITTLYSCFQNKNQIFFVMEYMSGGDLLKQLGEVGVFSEKRAKFYAAEITLAVEFLHQHGILHRDLKLENVLVGSDGHCKIADFGLTKVWMFRHCKTGSKCGTPIYMAPEMVKNLRYGQGVDWWAVGVMLFQMLTGKPPFYCEEEEDSEDEDSRKELDEVEYSEDWEEEEEDDLEQQIINDEVDIPGDMSLAAASMVLQLLKKNPEERLGANDSDKAVRKHPFFKAIDWKALEEKRVNPPKEEKRFSKVLKDDSSSGIIDQKLFQGFSFINYFGKQE